MNLFIHWLVATVAVAVTAYLLPGVAVESVVAAFVVALVLGIINAFVRPVLLLLTLPINLLTLGLFTFVINAALILLTSRLVPGFHVAGFWWAVLFGLVLSLVTFALEAVSDRDLDWW